ncbi:MAG TPA: CHASE2 domain-containing protein [Opitutaceae bacterium]|nr:CHASE2 domain-containing protein [Opitutaceae bacterium]
MAAPKKTALPFLRWLLLLPLPLLWCVADHYGKLDFLENKTVDWRFRYRGEIAAPVKVVYVDIDSESLQVIGNWPWSRALLSRVCSALVTQAGVKAIGIDIVTSDIGQSQLADHARLVAGNLEFASFLKKSPPVVLAASFSASTFYDDSGALRHREMPLVDREQRPLAQIEAPEMPQYEVRNNLKWSPPLVGLIDTLDGDTRWVPLFAPTNVRPYNHLAVELTRLYYGLPPEGVKIDDEALSFVRADGAVLRRVPLTRRQILEINWFSAWLSDYNPRCSFFKVFANAEALKSTDEAERAAARTFFAQAQWKNAVVLIGPVDKLMQDLGAAPFDGEPVPKVGVHGNLVKTLVSGQFLRRLPVHWNYLLGFVLSFAVAGLAITSGARSAFAKVLAVLAVAAYVMIALQLFGEFHVVLPLTAPLGAMFTTSFTALVWQVWEEQKQKGRIKGMFGTYLSPTVVNNLIESGKDPELGGHDAEITAYFSDIQEFSSFSEVLPASKLGELLNEYLSACTDIVQAEGGTLDKFIGDAVVAMYGAPVECADHAYRACVASQLVQRRIGELREKWRNEGDKWPQRVHHLQTRIGLNTGVCMIGNMGSRTRFNYTMMGDNVNLAARMESGAKSWGAYSMVAEATRLACEQHGGDRVVFRPLGRIVVKGRSQAVPIFEIVGLKEFVTAEARECTGLFAQGLASYYARDWDAAIASFQQSVKLEPNQPGKTPGVKSNPSLVYLDITAHYRAEPPPENWDGVYVMKEK